MTNAPKNPQCIAFILDGNRRWAKERGLSALEGHQAGMRTTETIARACSKRGIPHTAIYVFSTENWNRSAPEVTALLTLFESSAKENAARFLAEGAAMRFVGQRDRLPPSLQATLSDIESKNPADPTQTLWVCISYGSRAEIAHAAREAAKEGGITEDSIGAHLWTAGMPNPDIIVRTGGEKRISNFLLWQGAYAELFFVDTYWPDFTKEDLDRIISEYQSRDRRIGT